MMFNNVFTRKAGAARALQDDLRAYALELQRNLRNYPPQMIGKPAQWKSERQRRFVLASIRQGTIQAPRPRTGVLAAAWTVSPVSSFAGYYEVSVTNAIPYAAVVYGRHLRRPGSRDMVARNWRNLETEARGLLSKYQRLMHARIRFA